jgi:asparagine synthase (glutamine-hydrolysing)
MARAMIHRGPDDEGILVLPGVGLGSRRLSIIDVSGGHQPISNEDETVWVVLNGEIYNYRELRAGLESRGHRFSTHADTEVLVHLYEESGEAFISQLNGMFAFALWDTRQRTLLMARDRCGIKPLYYSVVDGTLAFGSELRTLIAWPRLTPELDASALAQYLLFEYVPQPLSMLKGVSKVPPGSILTFRAGDLHVQRFWEVSLENSETGRAPSEAEAVERLQDALREAVRLELVSDVPLGVFLSGGIDSSALALAMSQEAPGQVQSFSIGFENKSFDESGFARTVADHLGTQHHEMTFSTSELLDLVPRLPDLVDEPLGDSSVLPTHLLSGFARRHVTVALGGDGGDELFAGYSTLQAHRLAGYYNLLPHPFRRYVVEPAVRRLPVSMNNLTFDYKAKRFVASAALAPEVRHQRWLGSFAPDEIPSLLGQGAQGWGEPLEPVRHHLSMCKAGDPLNQILHLDMKMYLEGDILPKVDRASMACSLEARVPLLNNVMVDLVTSLPMHMKLRGFTRKWLLRKALHGALPESILRRPKKGFNIPVAHWLRTDLKELMLDTLSADRLRRNGWLNPPTVQALISDHLAGVRDNRKQIWTLLVFCLWADEYLAGKPGQSATPSSKQTAV